METYNWSDGYRKGTKQFKTKPDPQAYKNGVALKSHKISVHNGLFDPNCPACKELAEKARG